MRDNKQLLHAALTLALADADFMGNNKKVDNAIQALTPKDSLTRVFKQLLTNAKKDFYMGKDEGRPGYTDEVKEIKIRDYVSSKFRSYIDDPKTSVKANDLFNAAYPTPVSAELGQTEQESSAT